MPRILAAFAILAGLSVSGAMAGDLVGCETSIAGETQTLLYDPDIPGLKYSLSLREKLYGARGAISCPGLVTLRAMTPELSDTDRTPFCLQWDARQKTYIGYDFGDRDAFLTCRKPRASFCQRVNRSKHAAAQWAGVAGDMALQAGTETLLQASGAVAVKGTSAVIGEKLLALGASATAGSGAAVALGAVAVTAIAVGGAIYVCPDDPGTTAPTNPTAEE